MKEIKKLKAQAHYALKTQQELFSYDPYAPNDLKTTNALLTLFVARLPKNITEDELRKFMTENGGEVVSVRIIKNPKSLKKCYAFVEFANKKSLEKAYKTTDGVSLGGSSIVVDVERGRTVRTWVPSRLGGGLGGPPRQKNYVMRRGRGQPEFQRPIPAIQNNRKKNDRERKN